ncbi:hypothetical protein TRFO_05361 [Tritrichomonas foetus]|uniref:Uncharacterized protein n=1 Tax=Tritrichomonas foetus TaxID=1144522 RepID=A0A1J4K827_9EUKA|nr:hypothetical protein TRFO_05361 [Tritrichomonas foetus]|eukprot:OHT07122.1 hypothetical protein TRFO_05361 [Tritrichomonas foetus]
MRRNYQTFPFKNYSNFFNSTQQQQQQNSFLSSNFDSENIFSSTRRRIDNMEIQRHEEAENYLENNVIIVSFASFIVCFIENGIAYFGYEAFNILLNQVKRNVSLRKIIENGNNKHFHDNISIPFYVPQNGYNFEYESKQYGVFQYFNFGQCAKIGNGNQIAYVGSKEFFDLLTSWFYKNIISTEAGSLLGILNDGFKDMLGFYKSQINALNRGELLINSLLC